MYDEQDFIENIIPHRLGMIELMLFALEMRQAIVPKKLTVYIDDKPYFQGLETAFTNPAIEAGIINCRAMLEFLGLRINKNNPSVLETRPSRKYADDMHIDDFKNADGVALEKVTPDKVRRLSIPDREKGEKAIARLLHISDKEIAHCTIGRSGEDDGTDIELLFIGANGIRALTVSYFYIPLGLKPPENLIKSR